jgi:hypothetical protein
MKTILLLAGLLLGMTTARAQFAADFENGNLEGWLQAPPDSWSAASTTGRLSGRFSLQHAQDTTGSTDCISTPLPPFSPDAGATVWRFRMKYSYNPTAGNKWAVVLMADTPADAWAADGFDGYAVGVNMAAGVSDKLLCLYAVHNTTYTEVIKTSLNGNADNIRSATVAVEIGRSAAGEWHFALADNGLFDDLQAYGAATHADYRQAGYFGALNVHTSAGGKKLWFDDITVTSSSFPATLVSVEPQGNRALRVRFSRPMQTEGLSLAANYSLTAGPSAVHPQSIEIQSPEQLLLTFAERLPRGNATLSVQNLQDENGNAVAGSKTVMIAYFLYGDVVFNEIMASPVPSVALPEVSYIELYNRSGLPVSLSGWKVEYIAATLSVTVGNIGAITLPANGYLILCTSAVVEDMSAYGVATSVSNLSSLTKSGKTIQLKSDDGALIARLTYSDQWATDETKRTGGWSLEKIDPDNLSESTTNWTSSTDEKGGTPGQPNSVQAHHPDTEPPRVTDLFCIDDHSLQLTFNELFDTIQACNPAGYLLDNGMAPPQEVLWSADAPERVVVQMARPFTKGTLYRLTVTAPFCDLAGNPPEPESYPFGDLYAPAEREVVINEVLFDPYPNGVDFVEIYNRSDKTFDLRQFRLAHRDKTNAVASVHHVTQTGFLPAGDYAVFTTSPAAVQSFYFVPYPEKIVSLTALPSYPDDAGCVVLLSADEVIIDELAYSSKMHSGFLARPEGISLERVNPERESSETANWQSAAQTAGWATPTGRNSQYNTAASTGDDSSFSLPYAIFSPDGDGYNDVLYIDYQMPEPGYVVNITVYDMHGRFVKAVEKKTLLGLSGRLSWDGARHDNHKAAVGAYLLFIEYFDLKGTVKQVKKSCAVGVKK